MSIFSVILKRLEPRVPAALLGDPDTRQRSLLAIGCAYSFAAVSLSLVPFMGSTAEGLLRLIPMVNTAASAALLLLTGPLLRRTRSLRVAGNWMTGLLFAGLTFALFSGGMVSAPFWGAMIVLPLLATVLAGRGSGVAWGVAVCATYMLVYALDRSGVTPTDLTPPGMRDQMTVLGAVASTVVVTIAPSLSSLSSP